MKSIATLVQVPAVWRSVALLSLGLLSGTGGLLLLFGVQGAHVHGLMAGFTGLMLLCTVALVYLSIRFVIRSERARHKEKIIRQTLQEAIDTLPTGLAIYDANDRLQFFNRAAAELYPYRAGVDSIGQTYEALVRRALQARHIADALGREEAWLQQRLDNRGKLQGPQLCQTHDGRWMQFHEVRTPSGFLVMERNEVTTLVNKNKALESSNEQLSHLSITDALTGLANRRMLDQCLHAEWQRGSRSQQPLSFLMIDIDHFKRYNDHYGHVAGDACLRKVASILFDCSQRTGEVVARYGGEEFVLLLPNTSSDEASRVAQRCMGELERVQIPHANSLCSSVLTLSIGVATMVAAPQINPETLIEAADVALYRAKDSGRGHYELAPSMPEKQ